MRLWDPDDLARHPVVEIERRDKKPLTAEHVRIAARYFDGELKSMRALNAALAKARAPATAQKVR